MTKNDPKNTPNASTSKPPTSKSGMKWKNFVVFLLIVLLGGVVFALRPSQSLLAPSNSVSVPFVASPAPSNSPKTPLVGQGIPLNPAPNTKITVLTPTIATPVIDITDKLKPTQNPASTAPSGMVKVVSEKQITPAMKALMADLAQQVRASKAHKPTVEAKNEPSPASKTLEITTRLHTIMAVLQNPSLPKTAQKTWANLGAKTANTLKEKNLSDAFLAVAEIDTTPPTAQNTPQKPSFLAGFSSLITVKKIDKNTPKTTPPLEALFSAYAQFLAQQPDLNESQK